MNSFFKKIRSISPLRNDISKAELLIKTSEIDDPQSLSEKFENASSISTAFIFLILAITLINCIADNSSVDPNYSLLLLIPLIIFLFAISAYLKSIANLLRNKIDGEPKKVRPFKKAFKQYLIFAYLFSIFIVAAQPGPTQIPALIVQILLGVAALYISSLRFEKNGDINEQH